MPTHTQALMHQLSEKQKALFDFWEFTALKTAKDHPQLKPVLLHLSSFALHYCANAPEHPMDFNHWFGPEMTKLAEKITEKQPLDKKSRKKNKKEVSLRKHFTLPASWWTRFRLWLAKKLGRKESVTSIKEQLSQKVALIFLESLRHFSSQFAKDLAESGFVHMMRDIMHAYDEEDAPHPDDIKPLMSDLSVFDPGRKIWPQAYPQYWRGYVQEVQAMLTALQDEETKTDTAITYGCSLFYAGTQFMYATEMLPSIDENIELLKLVNTVDTQALRPH